MNLFRISLTVVVGATMTAAAFGQHDGGGGSHSSGGSSHSGGYSSGSHYGGSSFQGSHSSFGSSHFGSSGFHSYSRHSSSGFGHFGSSFSHGSYHSSSQSLSHSEGVAGHGLSGSTGEGHSAVDSGDGHSLFSTGSSHERETPSISRQFDRSSGAPIQHLSSTSHSNYTGSHNIGSTGGNVWSGIHGANNVQGYHGHIQNWRSGYHSYYPGFHDSFFFFGGYLFDPWTVPCVVSPWYLYPSLPGYLPYASVSISNDNVDWNDGGTYAYAPDDDPNSYGNPDLNYSLDELSKVFNNSDEFALGEMVDPDEAVGIYNDGTYMYSVKGTDFHQMMLDNIHAVESKDFSILSVRQKNDQAIVRASHEFSSPEGGDETVYQEYRLQLIRGRFVIVDFNTSKNPTAAQTFF